VNHNWIDSEKERQRLFFVPGGDPGPAHVTQRHGYTVRERGDVGGEVVHSYRCAEHGAADLRVPRAAVPDVASCPTCGGEATWAGSSCGIGVAAGEVTC
jgi:hypothetical protein